MSDDYLLEDRVAFDRALDLERALGRVLASRAVSTGLVIRVMDWGVKVTYERSVPNDHYGDGIHTTGRRDDEALGELEDAIASLNTILRPSR